MSIEKINKINKDVENCQELENKDKLQSLVILLGIYKFNLYKNIFKYL